MVYGYTFRSVIRLRLPKFATSEFAVRGRIRALHGSSVAAPTIEETYDVTNNPQGIVNLGTGTNYLLDGIIHEKVSALRNVLPNLEPQTPEDADKCLTETTAGFMSKFFKSSTVVEPSQIKIMNNVTACIDLLGTFLGQPNDVFLCPAPAYSRLFHSTQYSALEVVPVPLQHDKEKAKYFCLNTSILEKAMAEQTDQGKVVRGVLISNPNNPTGAVYDTRLILDIMELCKRHELHLILSEVYCLSVFKENTRFRSILTLPTNELPDPERVHLLWGMTKDLCLTGFHAAVIHSKNSELMSKIQSSTLFRGLTMSDQQLLTMYINDHDWIENHFLVQNREKMRRAFYRAKQKLESLDIDVFPAEAGFFLFCNFERILNPVTEKNCIEIFRLLTKHRVYVVPYWEMRGVTPGWYRIVFTAEDHIFDTGFDRISAAVKEWKLMCRIRQNSANNE